MIGMKLAATCALAGSLTATACAGSSPPAAAGVRCNAAHARVVASDSRAAVLELGHSYYGCSKRSGRRTELGGDRCLSLGRAPGSGGGSVGLVRLRGPVVGYAVSACGVDTSDTVLTARDLDRGTVIRQGSANLRPVGPESFPSVTALVVSHDGGLAWISVTHSIGTHRSSTEVDRLDSRGSANLDTGSGIDTRALTLSGTTLAWRDGGARRSSDLR